MDTNRHYRNFLEWNTNGTRFLPIFLNGDELTSIPGTYGLQQVIHNMIAETKELRNAIVEIIGASDITVSGIEGSEKLNFGKTIDMFCKGIYGRYEDASYPDGVDVLSDALYANKYLVFDINETTHEVTLDAVTDWKSSDGVLLGYTSYTPGSPATFTLVVEKTYMKSTPDNTQTLLDVNAHEYYNPYVYYDNNLDMDITGTANFNSSGDMTFQFGGSTQMTVNTNEVSVPDLKTTTTLEVTTGSFTIEDPVTANIRCDVSFLGDSSARHSLTNVNDIDATTGTIATFDCTTATIPTVSGVTNFTSIPTQNSNAIVDIGNYPNLITAATDTEADVNIHMDLNYHYILEKNTSGTSVQYSGTVIYRDSTDSPAVGKAVYINSSGTVTQTADNAYPAIGIVCLLGTGSNRYILTHGFLRYSSTLGNGNIGKVVYKTTSGGLTIDPSALSYAQPVGTITDYGSSYTEIYVNPSTVVVA